MLHHPLQLVQARRTAEGIPGPLHPGGVRWVTLVVLSAAGIAPLHGQSGGVADRDTVLVWHQISSWQARGILASLALVAETTLVLRRTPGAGSDSAYLATLGGDGATVPVSVTMDRAGAVRTFQLAGSPDFDWELEGGLLVHEAMAHAGGGHRWPASRRTRRVVANAVPEHVGSLFGQLLGGHRTEIVRIRDEDVIGHVRSGGREWLRIRSRGLDSIVAIRFLDPEFQRTRVEFRMAGPVEETLLFDPATGELDSLHATAAYRARVTYFNLDGRATTVDARWDVRRTAIRAPDPGGAARDAEDYFVVHGRNPPEREAASLGDLARLAADAVSGRAEGLDSLLSRRTGAVGTAERVEVETNLRAAVSRMESDPSVVDRLIRWYRPGDTFLAAVLLERAGFGTEVLSLPLAEVLVQTFGDLAEQRREGLNRESAFERLFQLIGNAGRVDSAAADLLARAAMRVDDPNARDLFLLAAYRGQPRRYLPVMLAHADTVRGFGPLVRRYASGDPSALSESWGISPWMENEPGPGPLPSLEAPWRAHRDHARAEGGYWDSRRFVEWLAAHEPDGVARLLGRFASETEVPGRLVWADYLFQLGDFSPVPWVRSLTSAPDSASREQGYDMMLGTTWGHLFQDTLPEGAELAELQNLLLRFADGEASFVSLDGSPVAGIQVHDETPGEHLLIEDNLSASIRQAAHWRDRFELISEEQLQRRVDSTGLRMAVRIGPITRVGDRYEASVALLPYARRGEFCLCGGGARLEFVRRGDEWMVLSYFGWIS